MSWRLAKSLEWLRNQINQKYPGRDKTSDGAIGDVKHRSRTSDHNPWVVDKRGIGVVTAIDIDEDLSASIHSLSHIVDAICASRDPRVKYIIYESRITVKGSNLQEWKKYTGPNSHSHHAHISVFPDPKLYDSTADWSIDAVDILSTSPELPASVMADQFYYVVRNDSLWGIARKFKTSVAAIKSLNSLVSDTIQVGQKLQVR